MLQYDETKEKDSAVIILFVLTSDFHAFGSLFHSSNQQQQQSLLHIFVSIDLWRYGAS